MTVEAAKRHLRQLAPHVRGRETAAYLAAVVVAMEWQPIETAPKDGTHILATNREYGTRETHWRVYGEGSIAKARFEKGEGPSGAWDWTEPQSNWAASWAPTEWMPLPSNVLADRREPIGEASSPKGDGRAAG